MITFEFDASRPLVEPTWLPGPHGRRLVRVAQPILVRSNGAFLCLIEQDFLSDRMSWPWWLPAFRWLPPVRRWLQQKRGRYLLESLTHDHLIVTRPDKPRWSIDADFYVALRSQGVSALEAAIFTAAVRTRRWRRPRGSTAVARR